MIWPHLGRYRSTKWYVDPEEIQRDLERFLDYYNLERSHQGYRLRGRTPAQALCEALGLTLDQLPPVPKEDNDQITTEAEAA